MWPDCAAPWIGESGGTYQTIGSVRYSCGPLAAIPRASCGFSFRARHVDRVDAPGVLKQAGLSVAQVDEMYRYLAIANYEDRFVIPTAHREYAEDAFDLRASCGFSFGNGCSGGTSETSLFGMKQGQRTIPIKEVEQ